MTRRNPGRRGFTLIEPKYHKDSELTAEVSPDQTTFNFDLKSKSQ